MSNFWDSRKSAVLTMVVAWLGLGLGLAGLGGLVPLLKYVYRQAPFLGESFVARAAGPLYACLVCGIAAVIITLLLLGDIRRGEVFTATNVRRLRLISYCGYAITLACVVGLIVANPWLLFAFIGLVAGFMSLLMRVIKNVIDTARLLKEDADFTI